MRTYIVIPAHNEAEHIGKTLQSLVSQTVVPDKIVVVDDQSTDDTAKIIAEFSEKYPFILSLHTVSSAVHLPGSKVIDAFLKGYSLLDEDYDIICKFDADLIFPDNYIERIINHFRNDRQIGMAGGFCVIFKKGKWELENLTSSDHLRGALKAYRKECFLQIGKLKPAMGWDTVDELQAQYHGWKIKTDKELLVKHLKPTGGTYNKSSKYKQGEAFYRIGYGLPLTIIASLKLALKKRKPELLIDYMSGYFKAKRSRQSLLVSREESDFIRKLRWKKMREKFLKK